MTNYIRACFWLDENVRKTNIIDLINILKNHGLQPINPSKMNLENWVEQEFVWIIGGNSINTRIFHHNYDKQNYSLVSFDIDEFAFFSEMAVTYYPENDSLFEAYNLIILDLVKYLLPKFGAFDYEEDLQYIDFYKSPEETVIAWGNYIPSEIINQLRKKQLNQITKIVDYMIPIMGLGLIVYIFPLAINQAWTTHHEELDTIVRPLIEKLSDQFSAPK